MEPKTTKGGEHSPAKVKAIKELADAFARNRDGKATPADFQAMATAPDSLRREARAAAGISSPRGRHSDVTVLVNGRNGVSVDWKRFGGLKALAGASRQTVTIQFVPGENPSASPVSPAKINDLLTMLDVEFEKPNGLSPSQCAEKVASGK